MKTRAFVRYSKKGKIVPGSLILTSGSYPQGSSTWNEVPADLCCNTTGYGRWSLVTGGVAGDGKVLVDGYDGSIPSDFTIVGPNDSNNTGWVYLKRYFPTGTSINIQYNWTSFDEGTGVDWPVYWTSPSEPTGEPSDLTVRVGGTPENGTWTINIDPGEWLGVGIYSSDSCCGRGFLQIAPSI